MYCHIRFLCDVILKKTHELIFMIFDSIHNEDTKNILIFLEFAVVLSYHIYIKSDELPFGKINVFRSTCTK